MNIRRFEYREGKSSKFWETWLDDQSIVVRFGRIGTTGGESRKRLTSAAKAASEQEKLIQSKLRKGYTEINGNPAPATPKAPDTSSFPSVYLVSRQLTLAKNSEVDRLEKSIGFALPNGYRQWVTELGDGTYCGDIYLHLPSNLAKRLKKDRRTLANVFDDFWGEQFIPFPTKRLKDVVLLGMSTAGDWLIALPDEKQRLFILKRDDDVRIVTSGLADLDELMTLCFDDPKRVTFPFFTPSRQAWANVTLFKAKPSIAEVIALLKKTFATDGLRCLTPFPKGAAGHRMVFVEALGGEVYVGYAGDQLELTAYTDPDKQPAYEAFLKTAKAHFTRSLKGKKSGG